ncbi:MAG TPA: SNF2 helicase-associated domain-containing protein, partial [bacterium]|nr:SNF2 helicase-associated domain-containing protein [bacterium]
MNKLPDSGTTPTGVEAGADGLLIPALSPSGTLRLIPTADAVALPPGRAAAIHSAFARGTGAGLLHLGLAKVETKLPPVFEFWRDFACEFVTAFCHQPELEAAREQAGIPLPAGQCAALVAAAPPMLGAEYLTAETLVALWREMHVVLRERLAKFTGTVAEFLHAENPLWNLVGRVCFHLAENKADQSAPFAFVATYTTGLSAAAKVRHRPLGRALEEYAGAKNKKQLLALLEPVSRAAARSALVRELVDSGDIYHPLAWPPAVAHRFLKELPVIEAAGITVRVPDWWSARRTARPLVQVTIGEKKNSILGLSGLLDFSVRLCLDGEQLSAAEIQEMLAGADGLRLLKGRWVEVDRQQLTELLAHWLSVEKNAGRDGVSFIEGLRLLAGAPSETAAALPEAAREWQGITAGAWLGELLNAMRSPEALAAAHPGAALKAKLRPYQEVGVRWLRFAAETQLGVCLADDMGL